MIWREERSDERKSKLGAAPGRASGGENAVKLGVEEFFRRVIAEQLARQGVDDVPKHRDRNGVVVGNALSFRDEAAQQPVVAFNSPFLAG